jgi:hypothetical protein
MGLSVLERFQGKRSAVREMKRITKAWSRDPVRTRPQRVFARIMARADYPFVTKAPFQAGFAGKIKTPAETGVFAFSRMKEGAAPTGSADLAGCRS